MTEPCSGVPSIEEVIESGKNMDTSTEYIKSTDPTLIDQYGNTRKTMSGNQADIDEAIASVGWVIVGDFSDTTKVEIKNNNEVYTSNLVVGRENELWRTNQPLPYTPTGDDPTSGAELGKWADVQTSGITDLESIARSLNVSDSDIIYDTNIATAIPLYIYSSSQQLTYVTPLEAQGDLIVNLTDNQLETSSGVYLLGLAGSTSKSNASLSVSSFYEEGDTRLDVVWSKMIADIQLVGSASYGKLDIKLDTSPIAGDAGTWKLENPCPLLSGMTVNGNNTLVDWVNQDTGKTLRRQRGMFEAIGTSSHTPVDIIVDIARGSNVLTLSNTADIVVGGYVNIEIVNAVDQTTGTFPIIYDFAKVLAVDATTITVSTIIDWDIDLSVQDSATVKFFAEEDVPKNITVKDIRVIDTGAYVAYSVPPEIVNPEQPAYVVGPFFFQYVDNVNVQGLRGKDLKCPLVQYREYTNCKAFNCYSNRPLAVGAGEGYTCQMSRGNRGVQQYNGGYNTRHVGDFTSAYDFSMLDCWDDSYDDQERVSFFLHGRYESKGRMKNLTGKKLGLGAGFSFGNQMKDLKFEDLDVKIFQGRGATGVSSILNSSIGEMLGGVYFEDITLDNVTVDTGGAIWRRETRLSNPIESNGVTINGKSNLRETAFTGFDNVTYSEDVINYSGGKTISLILMTDIKDTIIGGKHKNKRFKFTGACHSVTFPDSAKMSSENPTGDDGFISGSAMSNDFEVSLHGSLVSEYTGATSHSPCRFQAGSAAYAVNFDIRGLRCTGQWNRGGLVTSELTVRGIMTNCRFDNLSYINYSNTSGARKPWGSQMRCSNNLCDDETRNYDNINHMWLSSVIVTGTDATVNNLLTIPDWIDPDVHGTLNWTFDREPAQDVRPIGAFLDVNEYKIRSYCEGAVNTTLWLRLTYNISS